MPENFVRIDGCLDLTNVGRIERAQRRVDNLAKAEANRARFPGLSRLDRRYARAEELRHRLQGKCNFVHTYSVHNYSSCIFLH